MPIELKVFQVNPSRLAKIKRELGYIGSEDFFKTIPSRDFEQRILANLRNNSPKSGGSGYARYLTFQGYRQNKSRDQFLQFATGWRIGRDVKGASLQLKVWNLLETVGGKQGKAKFLSIEHGSTASTWVAKRTFRFKANDRNWVTIKEGRTVQHAATEGVHAFETAKNFIESVIVPEMGERITETIRRRLE